MSAEATKCPGYADSCREGCEAACRNCGRYAHQHGPNASAMTAPPRRPETLGFKVRAYLRGLAFRASHGLRLHRVASLHHRRTTRGWSEVSLFCWTCDATLELR